MEKTQNIRSKFPALVTYIIAVLALAVGLVLPLTLPMAGFDFKASAMFEIGGAFQTLFSLDKPLFGDGILFWSWPVTFVPGFTLDVGAILLLLYALVTVVAVVMIIPVCTTKKADEPAKLKSLKIASVMEVLALIVLSLTSLRA